MRMILILVLCALFTSQPAYTAPVVQMSSQNEPAIVHGALDVLEDPSGQMKIDDIAKSEMFQPAESGVPNYGFTESVYWFRFSLRNMTADDSAIIEIGYPVLDYVSLFHRSSEGSFLELESGDLLPFKQRAKNHRTITFSMKLAPGETSQYFLRIETSSSLQVPVRVYTELAFAEMTRSENTFFGAFYGIFLVMILFNLMLWFSLKDSTYLILVCYLASYLAMQFGLSGDGHRYIYSNYASYGNTLLPVNMFLGFYFGFMFCRKFLLLAEYLPRYHSIFRGFEVFSFSLAMISLYASYASVIQFAALLSLVGPILCIFTGFKVWSLGYQPARTLVGAWLMLCLGAVVFSLKSYGLLPNNIFTEYSSQAGAVALIVLLSLALANRIHVLNSKRVSSQNELLLTYEQLSSALVKRTSLEDKNIKLKNDIELASVQLIQADKLATLGSLAAGVAHEIANPSLLILGGTEVAHEAVQNLDKRLVALLDLDDEQAKAVYSSFRDNLDESETLIDDMRVGVTQITAINEAIRNQSRSERSVEEFRLRMLLEECSTILGSKSKNVKIEMACDEDLEIVARRSQLGQVITNLLSNAIDASCSNRMVSGEAKISVQVKREAGKVFFSVSDNGPGVPDELRSEIMKPFFTTKSVGQGTGLGMPICVKIIESHGGKLEISSDESLGGACFSFAFIDNEDSMKERSYTE
jgi:signal transduction histidine kinase